MLGISTLCALSLSVRAPPTLQTPQAATPHACRAGRVVAHITVRQAARAELLPSSSCVFAPVALLCAQCLFEPPPASAHEEQQLRDEMYRNLVERFSVHNQRPNALMLAEDRERGIIVGSCGVEVSLLTERGRAGAVSAGATQRALLSNLVVADSYRRQGVATRLLRESERLVQSWGLNEMLLKVEQGNLEAERLYRRRGYERIYIDEHAEKPEPGERRVAWVRTTNICLRKGLGELRASPIGDDSDAPSAPVLIPR